MDPQVTTFDQPKVQQQLFNGTAAMGIMFSGRMVDLTKPENTKFAESFDFAPPPSVLEVARHSAPCRWTAGRSRSTPRWTRICCSS